MSRHQVVKSHRKKHPLLHHGIRRLHHVVTLVDSAIVERQVETMWLMGWKREVPEMGKQDGEHVVRGAVATKLGEEVRHTTTSTFVDDAHWYNAKLPLKVQGSGLRASVKHWKLNNLLSINRKHK